MIVLYFVGSSATCWRGLKVAILVLLCCKPMLESLVGHKDAGNMKFENFA